MLNQYFSQNLSQLLIFPAIDEYSLNRRIFGVRPLLTACYARQSVEKQDSVSIEAQFEKCELVCRLNNWEALRYSDIGYSGSNINRPAFEQLISDIKSSKINRVISYRLDRISRSITDFANLLQLFEKYNVQYISSTENFDTSTPLGRAMVYIVMVFAQLERETITQRITDNYYYRAKQGLFMGGNCPLGYRSIKVDRNGKKASILETDPESSQLVGMIYRLFVTENYNPNKIAVYLNEKGIKTQKSSTWTRNKVIRILQNPAYAANNADIYGYFSYLGYTMAQTPEEYTGTNGLCIYGKEKNCLTGRKISAAADQTVVIGDFPPLVSSQTWLAAQYRLSGKKSPSRSGTGEATWLSGLIYCSICGHSMTVKSSLKRNKHYSYIHCSGHSGRGSGTCANKTYYRLSDIENCLEEALLQKVACLNYVDFLPFLDLSSNSELTILKNSVLSKIYSIDNDIDSYIQQIGKGTAVIDKYLSQKIADLDNKKASLLKEAEEIDIKMYEESKSTFDSEYFTMIANKASCAFRTSDLIARKLLATALINKIYLDETDNITIEWFL